MDNPTTVPSSFIGCDVGKTEIVVFDSRTGRTTKIPNKSSPLTTFFRAIDPNALVICEATGGYEADLLAALVKADRAAHRADARKVKAFIRSFGTLGKTDQIDARALARYGAERHSHLPRWQPRDRQRDELSRLVAARRAFVDQRVACRNRIQAPGHATLADREARIIRALDQEIAGIESDIKALIDACQPLARTVNVLRGISGVGLTTATTLLALMPEIGTLGRRQAASLAGLAPHPRQSGANDAYRRTKGGRTDIKIALFMAALTAIKHNPALKTFYERLRANGKKAIVALIAVMRKLLIIANARVRDDLAKVS
jgi:transposase